MTNEASYRRCALEAVLAAAAGRPPITKLRPLSRTPSLGGFRRSFVSVSSQKFGNRYPTGMADRIGGPIPQAPEAHRYRRDPLADRPHVCCGEMRRGR